MSGFDVQIAQLRSAAKAAGSAADQARVVEPGTGLEAIATALPGGVAAASAPALASTFNQRGQAWAGEIDTWSERVTANADAYAANEDDAKAAFGG
ncbi:hypothetical protein SAMN05421812_107165 [Asanoa hainanensis]|uniref:Excreted virulence factor EspC, type VII ESX diderm n=1 Tax=Asanoa hainanensis TaxID=560556 RepID=A0A239N1X8_9ACTN|nr:hypothetical protein [Asanoa hainanensis]SNT49027.1 hypothetical protein SAMN05421812_107165 [Asanoa hainanensis]